MAVTQRQMSNLPKEPTLKDGNKVVGFKKSDNLCNPWELILNIYYTHTSIHIINFLLIFVNSMG